MPRTHRKRGVGLDVGDDQRPAFGRDLAGHALAERHARPADLEAVEAVRRGQGQVRSIAVEQVERGNVCVEHVPGPVDDRLEQLVPGSGGRGEAGDLVQEAQLFELVRGRRRTASIRAPRWGRRRAAAGTESSARPSRYKPMERLRPRRLRRVAARARNGSALAAA